MMKSLALVAITLYQRYISPRKGFSCAYRIHTGGLGCSGFGKRVIQKHGFFIGLQLLRRRMAKCAWQAHQHRQRGPTAAPVYKYQHTQIPVLYRLRRQGGFVAADCDSCDTPSCDTTPCVVLVCCDLPGCDPQRGVTREETRLRGCSTRRTAIEETAEKPHDEGASASVPTDKLNAKKPLNAEHPEDF